MFSFLLFDLFFSFPRFSLFFFFSSFSWNHLFVAYDIKLMASMIRASGMCLLKLMEVMKKINRRKTKTKKWREKKIWNTHKQMLNRTLKMLKKSKGRKNHWKWFNRLCVCMCIFLFIVSVFSLSSGGKKWEKKRKGKKK